MFFPILPYIWLRIYIKKTCLWNIYLEKYAYTIFLLLIKLSELFIDIAFYFDFDNKSFLYFNFHFPPDDNKEYI